MCAYVCARACIHIGSLGAGVTGSCESPDVGARTKLKSNGRMRASSQLSHLSSPDLGFQMKWTLSLLVPSLSSYSIKCKMRNKNKKRKEKVKLKSENKGNDLEWANRETAITTAEIECLN